MAALGPFKPQLEPPFDQLGRATHPVGKRDGIAVVVNYEVYGVTSHVCPLASVLTPLPPAWVPPALP